MLNRGVCHLWTKVLIGCSIFTIDVNAASASVQSTSHEETFTSPQLPIANIVGGTTVTPTESDLYSSFAVPKFDTLFCGSILIWEDVLLTAAHCEGGYNFTAQMIMIGGTTLNGTDAMDKDVPVRKAIVHPDYLVASINNEVENDIMLVFLQRAAKPEIPLAKYNVDPTLPPDNALVTVIGHGIDNATSDTLTYQLNALNMTIVDFLQCDEVYDILNENVHLCAIGNPTAVAPCQGDSGGPLFYYDPVNKETIVVGLVSFGVCTYRRNVPSTVYTRVSTYPKWILSTICANSLYPPTVDMCNSLVPLARLPTSPTLPPTMPPLSPPTAVPIVVTDGTCPTNDNATTNECNFFIFFQNGGTYVHRSVFGICIQKCTIFLNLLLRTGWDCGRC